MWLELAVSVLLGVPVPEELEDDDALDDDDPVVDALEDALAEDEPEALADCDTDEVCVGVPVGVLEVVLLAVIDAVIVRVIVLDEVVVLVAVGDGVVLAVIDGVTVCELVTVRVEVGVLLVVVEEVTLGVGAAPNELEGVSVALGVLLGEGVGDIAWARRGTPAVSTLRVFGGSCADKRGYAPPAAVEQGEILKANNASASAAPAQLRAGR